MVRRPKREKSHRNFSTTCVSIEASPPNGITRSYEPGFITSPVKFGGVSRMEILGVAAVSVLVGEYEGLVVERINLLSGARPSSSPLSTTPQRHWKPTGLTKQLPLATTRQPHKLFCSSSQLSLKTPIARLIDCNPGSPRFLAFFFNFGFCLSWL